MNTRPLRLIFIFLLLILLSSCNKPTYSKEKTEQSVIELCKNEYGLDVTVEIIGSTLGVFIPIDGLVDPELRLDRNAGEKIEDVALSMHRVMMSTDKPLKFYTLTARDTKTIGAEFVLTGFVYDVVRVRLLDISRGEYHKRILRDFKYNPVVMGEPRIKELFDSLNNDTPLAQNIKPIFYPIYSIGKKGSQKIEIAEMKSKEISEQEALFYVKTREYYDVLPDLEAYRALFPPGFNNEYLILVNVSMFPNPIKEIVAKYFYSGTEIRQRDLQKTFDQYNDIGYIGLDGLPKMDLEASWFLSRQIARRIKILFEEDKRLSQNFTVHVSQGNINNKIFQFKFLIASDSPSDKDDEIIFSRILKLVGMILHRYDFEDFEGIEFIDLEPGGKKLYLSKDELERFRTNHIKSDDIFLFETESRTIGLTKP